MNRWKWAAVAAVVVVVLVGGTYLLREQPSSREQSSGDTAAENGSESSTRTAGSAAQATGMPGSAGGGSGSTGGSGGEAESQPGGSEAPASQQQVAAVGAALEEVTQPPGRTIAMFDPKTMPADTRLIVEFEPFGIGPWGAESLVVRINKITVEGDKSLDVSKLQGMSVIVRVEAQAMSVVSKGGAYRGTLRAIPDKDVTVLSVVEAEPAKK